MTVSYTHLDVYKRQELEGAQEMLQMALNRFGELPDNLLKALHQQQDIEAVSYTHLDVYKRQD